LSSSLLSFESLVVVWLYDEEHEYELEELSDELELQELELDDVFSPWYAVRVGRLEGTSNSGQSLPWAASM
jgi:hypothetical protein